jgi:CzcA family heavy metal efflux pump
VAHQKRANRKEVEVIKMWIVELAIRRPHTFVVLAILIAFLGIFSISRMPVDIFPSIDIPVVSVIWQYAGLPPADMRDRIVSISERVMTTVSSEISHIDSTSLSGMGIIKVYLRQGADMGKAVALMSAVNETIMKFLPPGSSPPVVTAFNSTDLPVLKLGVSSKKFSESELYEYGACFIRPRLATAGGCSIPMPYGGKERQVTIDIDTNQLIAKGLTPNDVVTALSSQNLILPAGDVRLGGKEFPVKLNSSPSSIEDMNLLPIKQVGNATIYFKDVAHIHDGFATQTNIVNVDGRRSTEIDVLRAGHNSTLSVVDNIRKVLPEVLATLPKELNVSILSDQTSFIKEAIKQVSTEMIVAALLTCILMLFILRSWRSALIVVTSIPLAILASVVGLNATQQTLNIMTLGGLALAVGMLVDDATVEIENIQRNLSMGKSITQAILDGASEIASPSLVSTLCICIVFIPVMFLVEPARSLFAPMGLAVVFAMLASYFLSRTLVPLMAHFLLRKEKAGNSAANHDAGAFAGIKTKYQSVLHSVLQYPGKIIATGLLIVLSAMCVIPFVGEEFFPRVDGGQIRLHLIAPKGTRLEETEGIFKTVESEIRQIIPSNELQSITENIGLPVSGLNLAYGDNVTFSKFDGELLISLKAEHQKSVFAYQNKIRSYLQNKEPQLKFFFQPGDIMNQILNNGSPAAIDIKVSGRDIPAAYRLAQSIADKVKLVPGAVDVTLLQVPDQDQLEFNVNRTKAIQLGLTQADVAKSVLTSLSSSFQTAPNYWLDPNEGVNYSVAVQTPDYKLSKVDDISELPVHAEANKPPVLLKNIVQVSHGKTAAIASQSQIMPVFDIFVNNQDRDLGSVANDIRQIVANTKHPGGIFVKLCGQANDMNLAYAGLLSGIAFALVLVYLLLVVNFQSWIDPLIVLLGSSSALSGVVLILYVSQISFSVPALMGAIMSLGVASANSILLVSFAEEKRKEGKSARDAAAEAGATRFRPIMMTALAMIVGMLPTALAHGAGTEANVPLGVAVIGGLMAATLSTLILVPALFAMIKSRTKHPAGNSQIPNLKTNSIN